LNNKNGVRVNFLRAAVRSADRKFTLTPFFEVTAPPACAYALELDLGAPVPCPPVRRVVARHRHRRGLAVRPDHRRIQPLADQVGLHRGGALARQPLIHAGRADAVGVAGGGDRLPGDVLHPADLGQDGRLLLLLQVGLGEAEAGDRLDADFLHRRVLGRGGGRCEPGAERGGGSKGTKRLSHRVSFHRGAKRPHPFGLAQLRSAF
jgi:hypothetical protein